MTNHPWCTSSKSQSGRCIKTKKQLANVACSQHYFNSL